MLDQERGTESATLKKAPFSVEVLDTPQAKPLAATGRETGNPLSLLGVVDIMEDENFDFSAERVGARQVFVGGDQRMGNELICHYLERRTGLGCSTGSLAKLLDLLATPGQDQLKVVLLDYDSALVREKLSDDLRDLLTRLAGRPAIIFNFNADVRIKTWIAHGIRGLLYLSDPFQNLVKAVRAVLDGQMWIPRQAMSMCIKDLGSGTADGRPNARLTQREKEILSILAMGKTNAEVARKLFISDHTVKVHVQNIFKKLGVPNRVKAAIWAQKNLDQLL